MSKSDPVRWPQGRLFLMRKRPIALMICMVLLSCLAASVTPAIGATPNSGQGTVDVAANAAVASPGDVVTYTITVHNGSQAGWYTLTDNLPPHTTLVSAPGCSARN